MSKYIPITKDNQPKVGDIIVVDRSGNFPDSPNFEKEFDISFIYEVVGISDKIDKQTGCPLFETVNLDKKSAEHYKVIKNHKVIGSWFNEWYIVADKSKRNIKINELLDD